MAFTYSQEFLRDLKESFPDNNDLIEKAEKGWTLDVDRVIKNSRPDLFRRSREEWAARPKENRVTQQVVNG